MQDEAPTFPLFFLDVGEPSAQRKRRNANQARSLVMTERRRRQRLAKQEEQDRRRRTSEKQTFTADDELEALCSQIQGRSPRFLLKPMDPEFASAVWYNYTMKSLQLGALSNSTLIERDIVALHGYHKPVTIHLHKLINHVVQTMWPKYWPAKNNNEVSPLAAAWWPLFVNVPAVFHAFLYAAAVHHDDLRGQTEMSQSLEILTHKSEALLQLQKAIMDASSTNAMDDSFLLAMTYLGMEIEGNERSQSVVESGPFNAPSILCSIQWTRHYAYAKENVHIQAAMRLVDVKGGIEDLAWPLAKSISINDLQIAAKYVRRPRYPFWDIPELIRGIQDPSINVIPEQEIITLRACGFQPLLYLGLNKETHDLLLRARAISTKIDLYTNGKLLDPDFHLLLCEKNYVHHGLLSLPTATEIGLLGQERDIYECCRIGALLYSTGVLFPLPPSTGTPRRLVDMTKVIAEDIRLEMCMQGGARLLIWVLVLAAITAHNTVERPWLLRRMKLILAIEGIKRWEALKDVLHTFLWMDSACEEAARGLFEDLSRPPYL